MAYVFSGMATQMVVRGARQQQRKVSINCATRELWAPGATPPAYLDGSLPGDFGYDPLGLAEDPADRKWMVHAELLNGRLCMMAVAGILFTSIATKLGAASFPQWFEAGYVAQKNSSIPFGSLVAVETVMVGFVEVRRFQELIKPGSSTEQGSFMGFEAIFEGTKGEMGPYPGGMLFDPMGMSKGSEAAFAEMKVKEVMNARLAMLAFLGFMCQYYATGKGPMDNFADHLADPLHNNFATNGVSAPASFFRGLLPSFVNPQ